MVEDVDVKYCPTNAIRDEEVSGAVYTFNEAGEGNNTYNEEWELDPDNTEACFNFNDPNRYTRPVFATCKNTCPGGETETVHINSL